MVEAVTRKLTTLRRTNGGEVTLLSQAVNNRGEPDTYFSTADPAIAINLDDLEPSVRSLVLQEALSEYSRVNSSVDVVGITLTIEIEDKSLDEEYVEAFQNHAMSKLSSADIKALDLVSRAVYLKTKYHKADK